MTFEIEDLCLSTSTNAKNTKQIINNMEIYKQMIYDIEEWIQNYTLQTLKKNDNKYHSDKNKYNNNKNKNKNKKYNISKKHYSNIKDDFHTYYHTLLHKYRVFCKKNILVYVYRTMVKQGEIQKNEMLSYLIQKRQVRNMSGVTIITLLTSPYPKGQKFSCKHNCYYCPNEPGQPRSYLKQEPAVARANRNKFDPILQMEDRLKSLFLNGHEIDKLEIILEGGTYTEYPVEYLEEFHRDFIYCANTYFDTVKRDPLSIDKEIELNATSSIRIIGICIETRPDALVDENMESWIPRFRRWGVTRIQLGVQHTENQILKQVNRGHTVETSEKAIQYLKDNGFKVDIHLMPDLPGATPEKDIEMFNTVFQTERLQPDQVKIYPCEITPWTVLQSRYKKGDFIPYSERNERDLLDVVKYAMKSCPPWIRLPRVIRDIPLTYIEGGNKYPNLRQMLNDEIEKEGSTSMDIRYRECGRHPEYKISDAEYITRSYLSRGGRDYFISLESQDRKCLFGFLRLRIPDTYNNIEFQCLNNMGLIRELHVYGNVVPVGEKKETQIQHMGIGRTLLRKAEEIAYQNGCKGIAVISGIGVVNYYKKNGYVYDNTYMIKEFKPRRDKICELLEIILFILIVLFYSIIYYIRSFDL